jgi:23S rRNA (cytidine1920-2'-O)/16S rRNA (cytidine1409-2'-O)-methyltransferase
VTKKQKLRLDEWLVAKNLVDSRSRAKALILAGKVMQETQRLEKPGQMVPLDAKIRVIEPPRFVSRGGEKLEGFIKQFSISMQDCLVLDVGASTGGFTDCTLQNGAKHVTCVDVGRAQLHNKLIQDPRVTNIEKLNARYLKADDLPHNKYPRVVMDLSFISLKKILPVVWEVLSEKGILIALIKPQFEAEKHEVDAGKGIITDPAIHERVLQDLLAFAENELPQSKILGHIDSPIKGTDGNKEFLVGLTKRCIVTTEE